MNGTRKQKPLHERFWPKVAKRGPSACWEWQGHKTAKGYGQIGLGTRDKGLAYAHRVSYMLATGEDPGDRLVCHRCDNPPCVNPAHLFLGSSMDNSHDARDKDRLVLPEPSRGEANTHAKLNELQVREIYRRRVLGGEMVTSLAVEFNVSPANISAIAKRKIWKHINHEEKAAA